MYSMVGSLLGSPAVISGVLMLNKGTWARVYVCGTRKKLSFSLEQYTTIFQAEMYAIKAFT
jgi:hypothetical protein